MKIGILTLPLHTNYGGIIQAYALQKCLQSYGHEVWLINRKRDKISKIRSFYNMGKKIFQKYIFGKREINLKKAPLTSNELLVQRVSEEFVRHNFVNITEEFYSTKQLSRGLEKYNLDLIVVGSDQVWRPAYAPNIIDYFGGFIRNVGRPDILSYAASFGTDYWEFSDHQTKMCAELIHRFRAVSVRENSGVGLCKERFNIAASHVLDPTMLLDRDDYRKLLRPNVSQNKGKIMTYILDSSVDKDIVVKKASTELNLMVFSTVNAPSSEGCDEKNIGERFRLETWLQGFDDCSFVITDSFHACVFSIIFNKPFLVYGNKGRGVARFTSLLKMFDLECRYIDSSENIDYQHFNTELDWEQINLKWGQHRKVSIDFLLNSLV